VPRAQVGALVGEDGGEFGGSEQGKRARAHDDLGADAGQAVGGRGRVVDHERAGNLRVAVREQGEEFPLPAPRPNRVGEGHHEHPAEHGEQGKPGHEGDQPDGGEQHRLVRGKQFAGR